MTTGNNQFLPFATGSSANVLTAAEYEALTALVANGFQSGIAQSQQVNTPLRQSTFVSSAIAQIIANAGMNANDDGNISNFVANFINALRQFSLYPGSVQWFAMQSAPSGFLAANGSAVSRLAYSNLFSAIGITYGSGDGSSTFNIPDFRGVFLRGWDSGRGIDPSRVFGSLQSQSLASHNHAASVSDPGHSHSINDPTHMHGLDNENVGGGGNVVADAWGLGTNGHYPAGIGTQYSATGISVIGTSTGISVSIGSTGSNETRPVNIALLPCIKY